MANPSQALVLRFNTDLSKAQNNIAQFASKSYLEFEKMNTYAKNARVGLDTLGKASTGLKIGAVLGGSVIAGVVALHALTEASHEAEESLAKLNSIAAGAAKAGVGTTFFQQFIGQAKELGIEAQTAADILEKLHESGQVRFGSNGDPNQTAFQKVLGEHVAAGNVDAQAATSIHAAQTAIEQTKLLSSLFDELLAKGARAAAGDIGEKLISKDFGDRLHDGVNQLDQILARKDALAAGGERIIPPEEIQRAVRMKAELDEINNRLAQAAAPILADIARWQQDILEYTISWKKEWAGLIELMNAAWPVIKGIAEASAAMLAGAASLGFSAESDITRARRPDELPQAGEARPLTVRRDISRPLPRKAKSSSAEKTDQVESYIKSLQKLVAAEQAEALTLGLGNKAKQEAMDLAKAQEAAAERGTELTQKEKDQVKFLADAYIDAKDKIEEFSKAQEAAKATGEFFGQTLESSIEKLALEGGNLKSVLLDIVKALEQAAPKAVLLGEGPFGSLFGTAPAIGATGTSAIGGLFGQLLGALPKFAEGGDLPAGRFGIVGERGPELIQGQAAITPFHAINAALNAGASRGGAHAVNMTIDVRGAQGNTEIQQMIARGVRAGMESVHGKIARDIGPMAARWNRRFG